MEKTNSELLRGAFTFSTFSTFSTFQSLKHPSSYDSTTENEELRHLEAKSLKGMWGVQVMMI